MNKLPDTDKWMLIGYYYEHRALMGTVTVKLVDDPDTELIGKDRSAFPPADKRIKPVLSDHVGGYLCGFVRELNTIVAYREGKK